MTDGAAAPPALVRLADEPGVGAAGHQHRQAVEGVVRAMRERLDEPLTLTALARLAYLSPFHFSRVFRLVTGMPPSRFLAALRMSRAKSLLLESGMSVTDVCTTVGYSSLGTFTTQFAAQVGIGPRRLRRLAAAHGDEEVRDVLHALREVTGARPAEAGAAGAGTVLGQLVVPDPDTLVMVGLFPARLALGQPVACTASHGSGEFQLRGVPDGDYHLLAAAHPTAVTVGQALIANGGMGQLVGAADDMVRVRGGRVPAMVHVTLAPAAATDPPILTGLPLLPLAEAA